MARWRRRALGAGAAMAAIVALGAAVRLVPDTDFGRSLIERSLDGLDLGRVGRLGIQGLAGDPWRSLSLARVTISDGKGVWLDARDIAIDWRPVDLVARRVRIVSAAADSINLLRRPVLGPSHGPGGLAPLSIEVDALKARLTMTPEFAVRRGVYDLAGGLDVERSGALWANIGAVSALHPGDHLTADVRVGKDHTFAVSAEAVEARGGALAGALGLAANQPFDLTAKAAGSVSKGAVFVASHVGKVSPLGVAAAWTPAGGAAHADLDLTASSLLADYRAMFGPVAHLDFAGRRASDGLVAYKALATAENLRLVMLGEADAGKLAAGPRGLALVADAPQANRLAGFPTMGALHLAGILTGDPRHWALAGAARVTAMSEAGYRLATVAGPVRLENHGGDLLIWARPAGEGGAGEGLLPALLGARPTGTAEVTRFADGRWLMRRLTLAGVGVSVEASGSRGLLGDLKFAGQARFANLPAAHLGAHGLVEATWTASQAGREPWRLSADAHGQDFAAGLAEADRLLGRAPRLLARAAWDGRALAVSRADLTGAAGSANAAGTLGGDGTLAMKIGWKASGPFVVGPFEIDGQMRGGGALAGSLAAPRAELSADFASLAALGLAMRQAHLVLAFQHEPDGADGRFSLAAESDYGPASAKSGFRFAGDGLDLTGLAMDAGGVVASGAVALRKGEPSRADLAVKVGPGVLLTQGRAEGRLKVEDAAGGPLAQISLEGGEAVLRQGGLAIKRLSFAASGPLARLPYQIAASGPSPSGAWRIKGAGELSRNGAWRTASFSGDARLRRADFSTLSPAEIRLGDEGLTARAQLAGGGGRADIAVSALAGAADIKAKLNDVDLALFDEDYVGKLSGDLALSGHGGALSGGLAAKLTGAGGRDLRGAPPVDGEIAAGLTGQALNVSFHFGNSAGLRAEGALAVPVEASAAPLRIAADYHRPLSGRVSIDGELKPIWDLIVARGGADSLSGQVKAQMTLAGTLSDPRATGEVALDGGRLQDENSGLRLENLLLRASLEGDAVDVTRFSADDGLKGQVSGQGRASLLRDGVSSFRAQLTGFRLIDTDLAHATASGQASVSRGADGKVRIAGALTIDRAQISPNPPTPSGITPMEVVEIHRPVALDDQPGGAVAGAAHEAPVALDVAIRAPRGVFVKGRGLDLELSLDAHVGGTIASPTLTGRARVVRGDYQFSGQRFQMDDRSYILLGSTPQTIRLDLTATREDPSLTAVVKISGTAARPVITLSSSPALPQDEILSRVLFGASASQLSGLEAAQLASAVAGLSGGGGFDLIGGLRSLAHLDRLAFGDSAATGTTVSGGKYLTDRIYVQITGGGREGESAQIEWRVKKRVSLLGKLGSQGDSQIAIRWRKSY